MILLIRNRASLANAKWVNRVTNRVLSSGAIVDRTRHNLEDDEWEQMIDIIEGWHDKAKATLLSSFKRTQLSMIARIADTSKLLVEDLKGNQQFIDFALTAVMCSR